MDAVLRAAAMYGLLLLIFRMGGKRTLARITPFDLVLLLVIAEATQQALLGQDYSVVNAALVIVTLVGIDIALSVLRLRWRRLDKLIDDLPVILVRDGQPLRQVMARSRVDKSDIMEAARRLRGLERMDQIKYAILETSGSITVIPAERPASEAPASDAAATR
jgi:uncharacterized membrane protein YcaP (DUF421 family)